jgi:hypothetical protein
MGTNTNALAVGTSNATSSAIAVTTVPLGILMMGNATPNNGNIGLVQIEDSAGNFVEIGRLTGQSPFFLATAAGTYYVQRIAAETAWGVDYT